MECCWNRLPSITAVSVVVIPLQVYYSLFISVDLVFRVIHINVRKTRHKNACYHIEHQKRKRKKSVWSAQKLAGYCLDQPLFILSLKKVPISTSSMVKRAFFMLVSALNAFSILGWTFDWTSHFLQERNTFSIVCLTQYLSKERSQRTSRLLESLSNTESLRGK